jgi:hypothetical protein
MAWIAFNLNWIRQRRAYNAPFDTSVKAPGALCFFGEGGVGNVALEVTVEKFDPSLPFTSYPKVKEAMSLFPEASIQVHVIDTSQQMAFTRDVQ